jgi:hypothetical protein
MKSLFGKSMFLPLLVGVLSSLLATACATDPEPRPFAGADAPHAILDFTAPPPGGDLTPAWLLSVDGVIGPAATRQRSYWVAPGEHELIVYGEALARDKVGIPARGKKDPGKFTMAFENGRRYYIAIRWLSEQRNDWRPTVWKVE